MIIRLVPGDMMVTVLVLLVTELVRFLLVFIFYRFVVFGLVSCSRLPSPWGCRSPDPEKCLWDLSNLPGLDWPFAPIAAMAMRQGQ